MNYRFDVRTKQEFKKDIKSAHEKEAEIAVRLAIEKYEKTGVWPKIIPVGSDMSGRFIEKNTDVTLDPDFSIDGITTEITRSDTFCKKNFHQKVAKVKFCIENGHDIVFVNGFGTPDQTKFLVLTSVDLKKYSKMAEEKYGKVLFLGGGKVGAISKSAYRFDIHWFDTWKSLPKMTKEAKENYREILDLTKLK